MGTDTTQDVFFGAARRSVRLGEILQAVWEGGLILRKSTCVPMISIHAKHRRTAAMVSHQNSLPSEPRRTL
jgi:hypothetical protein